MAGVTALLLYRKKTQPLPQLDYVFTDQVSVSINELERRQLIKREDDRHILHFKCANSPLMCGPPAEAMGGLPSKPERKDSEASPSLSTIEPIEGKIP